MAGPSVKYHVFGVVMIFRYSGFYGPRISQTNAGTDGEGVALDEFRILESLEAKGTQ